jgi:predicted nucleic acid-binding protein
VLSYALASQADLMVSGNAHLRNLKRCHGMHIVTAGEALAVIERQ